MSQVAQKLWAKKSNDGKLYWLPLFMHLEDCAITARKIWNLWLSEGMKKKLASYVAEGDAEQLLIFLAAAHDIGKATPVFQAKSISFIQSELDEIIEQNLIVSGLSIKKYNQFTYPEKTPHALASQLLLEQAGCCKDAAVIVGSHHGKPPSSTILINCGIDVYVENYYLEKGAQNVWSAVQKELINFALSLAGITSIERVPQPNMSAQVILSGLVIMTDWIASNEDYFPYINICENPELGNAEARANMAWKQLHFPLQWNAGNTWMGSDLFKLRFTENFEPYEIQSEIQKTVADIDKPGILVLEAPMGIGKTEAALVAAEILAYKTKRTGVFFALPTQATSNGIFPRMLKWIEKLDSGGHSIKLAHGKAQFNKDYQALSIFEGSINIGEDNDISIHEWFEGQKKSMLADFVVGTIDQLLLAALKQKHLMLRHLGIANKVVIIDECHAYDAYMSRYLDMALRWLGSYGVPTIVLSATLPAKKRQMVIEAYLNKYYDALYQNESQWLTSRNYPIITYTNGDEIKQKSASVNGIAREVQLEVIADNALVEMLQNLLSEGGCAGVVVNTVKRAQEIAKELRNCFSEETIALLHSRFLAPDRIAKENKLLQEMGKCGSDRQRPEKRIVVGTQVLEQSLDIDFDVLFTDICPIDLLLQRIGRLHRHERVRPKKLSSVLCFITGMDGDDFEQGTKAIYGEFLLMRTKAFLPKKLVLPWDISKLVQDVYDDTIEPSPEPSGYREAKSNWEKIIADKEKRAGDYRISHPWPEENLVGWLDADYIVTDRQSEAAVRDSDESIEVILIQEKNNGKLHFLPWIENGCEIPQDETDEERIKALACQSIRLPSVFCSPWMIDKTISDLEQINRALLPEWRNPYLKGELFLIMDENFSTMLCGYRLTYDSYYGLLYDKEEEDERKGL